MSAVFYIAVDVRVISVTDTVKIGICGDTKAEILARSPISEIVAAFFIFFCII